MPLDHCKECGSSSLDIDTAKGQVVCTACGEVNESTIVVNDPTYEDNGHGGASVIGTFVSGTSSGAGGLGEGFRGFRHGIARSSKEVTFDKIRREINDRGHQLRMEQHNIDKAFNIYKLAFENRLTKGRRNDLVIAAALYITCRCDGGNAQYLMIDFSEQFSVDIYELGRTYIHFTKALHFTLNSIDPCLYIMRFANRLEFGKQTTEVSNTAMRLVQRMKKDHLHVGRRPSGLCGAALLFAARHHGFNRKPTDIVKVVKVHESTLRKRMLEFGETPSSLLSFEDFMSVDLEEEQDPPAYKEARRKDRERREQAKRAKLNIDISTEADAIAEVSELQRQIEEQLQKVDRKRKKTTDNNRSNETVEVTEEIRIEDDRDVHRAIVHSTVSSVVACLQTSDGLSRKISSGNLDIGLEGPTLKMMGLGPNETHAVAEPVPLSETEAMGELDLEGLNDDELDAYILTQEETTVKEAQWLRENADYIKAQQEKEALEAQDRLEGKPEKKKRKPNRKKNTITPANTAGEAIEKMLKEKKLSQKINYDVLKQLRESSKLSEDSSAQPSIIARPPSSPSTRATPTFKTPSPVRAPHAQRKVHFKVGPHIPSSSVIMKKEVSVDRKPALPTKQESLPPSELEEDEDLEDEEEDEDFEDEEEEQPLSISHLLNEHEQMYGQENDYM